MKVIGTFVAFVFSFSCASSSPSADPGCVPEDAVIWEKVLAQEVKRLARGEQLLILYESTAMPRRREEGDIAKYFRDEAGVSLAARNSSAMTLTTVPQVDRVRFVSRREINALFTTHPQTDEDEWKMFYTAFPTAAGMIKVSIPGYSANGATALVYVEWQGGLLAAEGSIYRLRCSGGEWRVVRRDSQWVS